MQMSLNDPFGIACNTLYAVQNLPLCKLNVNVSERPCWHCLQHIVCSSKPQSVQVKCKCHYMDMDMDLDMDVIWI